MFTYTTRDIVPASQRTNERAHSTAHRTVDRVKITAHTDTHTHPHPHPGTHGVVGSGAYTAYPYPMPRTLAAYTLLYTQQQKLARIPRALPPLFHCVGGPAQQQQLNDTNDAAMHDAADNDDG